MGASSAAGGRLGPDPGLHLGPAQWGNRRGRLAAGGERCEELGRRRRHLGHGALEGVSCTASGTLVNPLTLRTYWRAAALISSAVAGGWSPRSS